MKIVEIRAIGIKSAMKAILYLMIVPTLILMLTGAGMMLSSIDELFYVGLFYLLGMPVFMVLIYPAMVALMVYIYNSFSRRWGGFKIMTIEEEIE